MPGEAFVTLATTDSYCRGAVVVARSLRRHGTTRDIVVMVTPTISEVSRHALEDAFDDVITVSLMDSQDQVHLFLLGRPELGTTFTKIHCWTLTQFSKCVFLDADTLVLCNVDELFDRDELSAAPDPGWPDCFNSGVFVFRPSLLTHARLLNHALHSGSFDGGDQGLLNSFFSSWPVEDISKHLPFIYNLCASTIYSYLPAFQQFGHNAKIVHFAGAVKPWSSQREGNHIMDEFVSLWWREYNHQRSSDPNTWPSPDQQHQQLHEQEAKLPFRVNLDTSRSLLAHFSPPSEAHHSNERTCSHTGSTPIEEESPEVKKEESGSPGRAEEEESIQPWQAEEEESRPPRRAEEEESRPPRRAEEEESRPSRRAEEEESRPPRRAEEEESRPSGRAEGVDPALGLEELKISDDPAGADASPSTGDTEAEQLQHRRMWESGHVDYLGRDAFQNIQKMLDRFLD